jgi:hypothetical protein
MYGLGNGIGLDLWEAPFLGDDEVKQRGWETAVSQLDAGMTLALRVVFLAQGRLIIYGDTFEVAGAGGPRTLTHTAG